MMNMPGLAQHGQGGMGGQPQTNVNTEAGDTESSEEQAYRMQQMKSMFANKNIINLPGMNPTKNKFNDKL